MKIKFHGNNFIYTSEQENIEYLFKLENDNITLTLDSKSANKKLCLVDKDGRAHVTEFRNYGTYAIKYKQESLIACFNRIRG
jgi:hypothetical protein